MFWPGEDPIGKELEGDPRWRVVGVSEDVQMRSLRSAGQPGVYYPLSQAYRPGMSIQVRGEDGRVIQPAVLRRMVAELDAELPVGTVVDLHEGLAASMGETRTIGYLVAAFAVLALVLAAVGLYGLVSYGASERVREMGIRIALGARPESLVSLILTRGLVISALGIGAGLVVSYGLGKALESLLFGVAAADATTLGAASAILFVTAGFAAWLPARRASRGRRGRVTEGVTAYDPLTSGLQTYRLAGPQSTPEPRMSDSTVRHAKWDDIPLETVKDDITRRVFTGDRMMIAHVYLDQGAIVPRHSHENEQLTYIVEGALRFWLGDEGSDDYQEIVVSAGEVLFIPSNVPHKAEALEQTFDLDVFSPPRQDWLDGTDSYFHDES